MFDERKRPRAVDAAGIAAAVDPAAANALPENCTDCTIPRESELRITVPVDEDRATIQVLQPRQYHEVNAVDAEVFGAPLAVGHRYALRPGTSIAVWSYNGCRLRLSGTLEWRLNNVYRGPTTNYRALVEYHGVVHAAREEARSRALAAAAVDGSSGSKLHRLSDAQRCTAGPRVIVCGGQASGRHSAARTLANYAVRQPAGWAPTVADLDPNHQMFGPSGTIGVAAWEYTSTLDEDVAHLQAAHYWVGTASPQASHGLAAAAGTMDVEASSAASPVSAVLSNVSANAVRVTSDRLIAHQGDVVGWSGSIVIAPAFADPVHGAAHIGALINASVATHVLVVGDVDLHSALLHRFDQLLSPALPRDAGTFTTAHGTLFHVDFISASPGAVDFSLPALENAVRARRMRDFFFGPNKELEFVPLRVELKFSVLEVVRFAEVDGQVTVMRLVESKYAQAAEKRVAALFRQADNVLTAPMMFPVHVDAVDGATVHLRICSVLTPHPSDRFILAVGSVAWLE